MMRTLGPEAAKSDQRRVRSGFYDKYLSGDAILDIGFRGGKPNAQPITDKAIGVELDYPGYDGKRLPFEDNTQDAVFVSHCLEHIVDYKSLLRDWYRVLKIGGYLIISVPHQYIYERKAALPSRFNPDHKRFYTPASLLREIEESLPLDAYRLRSLADIDDGFNYKAPADRFPIGNYEIELVIEKIARPLWGPQATWTEIEHYGAKKYAAIIRAYSEAMKEGRVRDQETLSAKLLIDPSPYLLYKDFLPHEILSNIRALLSPIIRQMPFDAERYLTRYPDLGAAYSSNPGLAHSHFIHNGYYEGRFPE
jgi:SAM-dependent methyltransferase